MLFANEKKSGTSGKLTRIIFEPIAGLFFEPKTSNGFLVNGNA